MNFNEFSLSLIDHDPQKITFVAIGNRLRGDDGISFYFIDKLKSIPLFRQSVFIDAGTNPENYLSKITQNDPELVVFIDAADFGGNPGEITWLDNNQIDNIDISTHAFSIKLVEQFLQSENIMKIMYLGIQPVNTDFVQKVSETLINKVNLFFSK